jgi:hypothetical protein
LDSITHDVLIKLFNLTAAAFWDAFEVVFEPSKIAAAAKAIALNT